MMIKDTLKELTIEEEKFKKQPSSLLRLRINNLYMKLNEEINNLTNDLIKQGYNKKQIDEIIKKIISYAFPMSINDSEIEKMQDFYFACSHNI